MNQEEQLKDLRVRFAKWDEIRRKQMSFTNNLILTFSVATIGFIAKEYFQYMCHKSLRLGFIALIISVTAGIALAISRLYDYRYTAMKLKAQKEKIEEGKNNIKEIEDLKETAKWLGKFTWACLWFQLGSFLVAIFLVGIFFLW